MLTMLALTLSVGIVIDDAIVVLENIYRFIEEKGMPPMQAAIEATREIGLAVLATTFSLVAIFAPGRVHERHGRPLHAELRPDDGLRRAGVAVRQLHADADDVGVLAEGAARASRWRHARLEAHAALRAARSRLHAAARVGDGASRHRRDGDGADPALQRAALPHRERQLHAGGRSVAVRRHACARRKARAWQATGDPRESSRERDPPDRRSRLHDGHGGRRRGRHAQHRERVRAAEAARTSANAIRRR